MRISKFNLLVGGLVLVLLGLVSYYFYLSDDIKVPALNLDSNKADIEVPKEIAKLPDYEKGNPRVSEVPETIRSADKPVKVLDVSVSSLGFSPKEVTVESGDIVTFSNDDTSPHQIEGEGGLWFSRMLNPQDKFSQQFDVPGIYNYSDKFNVGLKGSVIVK